MPETKMNVSFKRGLAANLPSAANNKNVKAGTFYLTTDTNRLYVGQVDGKIGETGVLAELNRYVKVVANTTELAQLPKNKDDFVYLTDGNILAVCTGSEWVQINPDHDTKDDHDTVVSEAKDVNVIATDDGIKVSFKLAQVTKDLTVANDTGVAAADVPVEFTISKNILTQVETAVSVGLGAAANTVTGVDVSTSGDGANTDSKVTIVGDGATSVTLDNGKILISSADTNDNTTYTLSTDNNHDVVLAASDNSAAQKAHFLAEDNNPVTVSGSASGITYKHNTITTSTPAAGASTIGAERTFTAVTSADTDGFGHVSSIKTTTFTLPVDNDTKVSSASLSVADSKLKLGLTQSNNDTSVDAEVALSDLGFITPADVDKKLRELNPMVYRGVVDSTKVLPTSNVQIGDTYMASQAGQYGGKTCSVGDLLIATGTEGADGFISSDLTWTYVPSGNDADTTYTFSHIVANNILSLKAKNNITNEEPTTQISSDNLTIESTTNGASINFVWGEF